MKKEIIGYKFIKPEYEKAAIRIAYGSEGQTCFNLYPMGINFYKGSGTHEYLEKAGVMHWFTPVYKKEPELEVGKWYKHPRGQLFCCTEIINGTMYGYGFSNSNIWVAWDVDGFTCACNNIAAKDLEPATDKEVEEALKQEAIKRGFKEGVEWFPAEVGAYGYAKEEKVRAGDGEFSYYGTKPHLQYDGKCIFKDGKWAEIISQPETYTIDIPKELKNKININWK